MNSTGEETVDAQVFAGGDSGTVVVNRDAMKDMPPPVRYSHRECGERNDRGKT